MDPVGDSEVKVFYFNGDGQPIRCVRGVIEEEDAAFITVRSGRLQLRLGKRYILKIERFINDRSVVA